MLHDILGVGFLREMTRESAVLVRGPLEVGIQEPVDGAHEFDLEFRRKQVFEAFLDGGVFGEVDKIVHVESEVERLVVCGRGRIRR